MNHNLFKQSNRHLWLGAFVSQFANSLIFITVANIVVSLVVLWQTGFADTLRQWFPWLTLIEFIGFAALAALIVAYFDYRFVQPGRMAYWKRQYNKHE